MENTNEQGEVIVGNEEAINEEVTENTEENPSADKPKRTPKEEYDYYTGKAKRLAKKHGFDQDSSSKPNELDMGGIAYLHSMVGLKGKDEIALARQYLANGKDILDLAENKFFNQDLQSLREAKETAGAVPKGKNRASPSGASDVDYAIARFKDTGELPDDFATRNKVIDAITASEVKPLFSGPSVTTK